MDILEAIFKLRKELSESYPGIKEERISARVRGSRGSKPDKLEMVKET